MITFEVLNDLLLNLAQDIVLWRQESVINFIEIWSLLPSLLDLLHFEGDKPILVKFCAKFTGYRLNLSKNPEEMLNSTKHNLSENSNKAAKFKFCQEILLFTWSLWMNMRRDIFLIFADVSTNWVTSQLFKPYRIVPYVVFLKCAKFHGLSINSFCFL